MTREKLIQLLIERKLSAQKVITSLSAYIVSDPYQALTDIAMNARAAAEMRVFSDVCLSWLHRYATDDSSVARLLETADYEINLLAENIATIHVNSTSPLAARLAAEEMRAWSQVRAWCCS